MTSRTLPAGTPSFRLDGKVALITGAGKGIGAGIAAALAATIVAVARTLVDLENLVARVTAEGGRATARAYDVRDKAAICALIDGLPRLDILVNNAGTNIPEPFLEVSEDHLDLMIDLNVRSLLLVSQCAVRKMLEQGPNAEGRNIINLSSQMGLVGAANRTAYSMTKHAVEGLTSSLAIELAPQRIRVNSIAPTFVDTPLVRSIVNTPEEYKLLVSKIPLGSMGRVEDIMGAALYLASPAAAMVTGTCLRVDGGW
ncbi:MAG: SDR family oxidoreductase, partial [Acetobacteraceae bacterium]|nr:SDR family oxidoreductase [Acetobacteraceae bacterium]